MKESIFDQWVINIIHDKLSKKDWENFVKESRDNCNCDYGDRGGIERECTFCFIQVLIEDSVWADST